MRKQHIISSIAFAAGLVACASTSPERRFPLREPMTHDTDLASVRVRCHPEPTSKDPHHISCAPAAYTSPLYWDGVDSLIFRPWTDTFGIVTSGEAVNVNSLDEVPDSSWFVNRIGAHAITARDLDLGACASEQLLDPDHAADGSWLIDKGKGEGSTPGFRVVVPGKGKFMLKADAPTDQQPERMAAASTIGAAIFHAVGYYISCERVVYIRPSILRLKPGLTSKGNFEEERPFDQSALDRVLAGSSHRNSLVRLSASAWLPGHAIGPFRFENVRADDPNDVVPHQDRRELRGMRVLASWLGRHDAREANSYDAWFADNKKPEDSSPGHVIHYQLDVSETFGSLSLGGGDNPTAWSWDPVARRLNHSYVIDWADIGKDLFTLGIPLRSWDKAHLTPERERFGYFNADDFDPDEWKAMYPNAAFSRATERDNAWMARILAHFTPEMVRALARLGDFTDPANTDYLANVLERRLQRILVRYLTRLSPIADVRVEEGDRLCAVDLAEYRSVYASEHFHYVARFADGAPLVVTRAERGAICVKMTHIARDGGSADDAPARYARVVVEDSVARGPLVVHLYDLGPTRGFRLVGLTRPLR